jgi:hypothetical protein
MTKIYGTKMNIFFGLIWVAVNLRETHREGMQPVHACRVIQYVAQGALQQREYGTCMLSRFHFSQICNTDNTCSYGWNCYIIFRRKEVSSHMLIIVFRYISQEMEMILREDKDLYAPWI